MELSQILTHLGEKREDYFQAIAPPIIQTSNFAFKDLAHMRASFGDEFGHHLYSRGNNPTVKILREKLAALEGTEDSLVFSSGAAAIAASITSLVKQGDHIICVDKPYSWTKYLLTEIMPRFGVEVSFIDGTNLANFQAALQQHTRLVYLESPNSLTFELQDLKAIAAFCQQNGLISLVDNSHCSPLFQQPHELGIDLILHSATKYLCGHSDLVMGVVCGSKSLIEKIFYDSYMCYGAVPTAQSAGLALRGLRTFELRVRKSDASALILAKRLEASPKVERVLHPLLPSFPQYELAKQQMQGSGGLFSCYLKTDSRAEVEGFVHRIQRFLLAVSWGGYESLMVPSIGFYDVPGKADSPLPFQLIRFYVGLEDVEWLWEDLEQALEVLS
ncbi:MAG: PLP-dependent aspartate aminotransferase family protein [Bacteroidota bacterium]